MLILESVVPPRELHSSIGLKPRSGCSNYLGYHRRARTPRQAQDQAQGGGSEVIRRCCVLGALPEFV